MGEPQPLTFDEVAALPAPAPDHTIAYGPAPQQFGHLRLPRTPGPHRVVIYIHGGCYKAEYSIAHAAAAEQALAVAGFAVWSLEYRRVGDPGGGWPGTFQDLAAGTDHLRSLAAAYSLDLQHVVAAGHSAGGNSALWLAARPKISPDSPLYTNDPLPIGGVLALAPAGDFVHLHDQQGCGGIMPALMGGSPSTVPDRYRAASPGALLPIGVPQAIVIADRDERFEGFGRAYAKKAMMAGDQVRVVDAHGAGHFDVIAPVTPTWQTVRHALDDLFNRI